jgi:hypothetical protein
MLFWNECSQAAQSGLVFPQAHFVCLFTNIRPKRWVFQCVFFLPKGEIQIQKVSDYIGFQSP